jgi:citrate lyase subunit beta/citryl-CoA lyase
MTTLPLLRSYLYVPAHRARFVEKAFQVGADAVILDLEDAVPFAEKAAARQAAAEAIAARAGQPGPAVFVRINNPVNEWSREDVRAVVRPGLAALRVPKVEDAATVRQVAAWIDEDEAAAGMPPGTVAINCSLESAASIFRVYEIATAHPRVQLLGFGVADYLVDLGIHPDLDQMDMATVYPRSQIVIACRVAGLRPPVDTVWPYVDDLANLERFARQARALGFMGKAAIHPKQVETINRVFTPSEAEIEYARKVIAAVDQAARTGAGAVILGKDEMVDLANVKRARDLLVLADRLGASQSAAG